MRQEHKNTATYNKLKQFKKTGLTASYELHAEKRMGLFSQMTISKET